MKQNDTGYNVAAVLLSIVRVPVWLWATLLLWGWFITPLFPAAPALTWRFAWGLMLTASMFRAHDWYKSNADATGAENMKAAAKSLIFPLIVVAIGWLVKP